MTLREYMKDHEYTQQSFGERVGVSQGMVSQWLIWLDDRSRGTPITAAQALQVWRVTNYEVTPHELRPDLYPNPLWFDIGDVDDAARA